MSGIGNRNIPKIFSNIELDTDFEQNESLNFIRLIFPENICVVIDELKQFKKEELQKLVDFIFSHFLVKNKSENVHIYILGELVFFYYHAKGRIDNSQQVLNDIQLIQKDMNIRTLYATVFWVQIEYMKEKLDIYLKGTIDAKILRAFCTLTKSMQFTFSKIDENSTINRANNVLNSAYTQFEENLKQSLIAGGEIRSKAEKSKGGKARADKYKHIKKYVEREYKEIITKDPTISNNKAVHRILHKMDKENFRYAPMTEYSRIDTLRKWAAKLKEGKNL